jgi:hypothetical protein
LATLAGVALGGASSAQSYRVYSAVSPAVVPGSATTSYSGMNVNRNPGSPYYGYLYVCDKASTTLKVKIFAPNVPGPAATTYTDTGLTIAPTGAGATGPWDVEIGPDDTVWIMNLGGNTIQTAPPVPPAGTSVTAITQIDRVRDTPTSVTIALGGFRGFGVKGPITAARVYIAETSSSAYQVFDVATANPLTAGTPTHVWSKVSAGGATAMNYGVAIDPAGNSYWTQSGGSASCLSKMDPAGNVDPSFFAKSPSFAGTPTLSDATFIPDATAPGGAGYILMSCRITPNGTVSNSNPQRVGVLRFALDGTCLDGFGPAMTSSTPLWSTVDLRARGASKSTGTASSAQYCGFDDAGNCYVGTDDGVNNGQIVKVRATPAASTGPWGDVDADGLVTVADANLVDTYIVDPTSLSMEQRERIKRYGDINGTQNVSVVGDGVVDMNDLLRIARVAAGILDPGTAGAQYPHYGDVDNDGKVTIADVVHVARYLNGLDAGLNKAPGVGDVAPTTQKVTFGDGQITTADSLLIRQRAMGTEVNPPAYRDYWPMIQGDQHQFTDVNHRSGDALSQTRFGTSAGTSPLNYAFEPRGYTLTEVAGDDGASLAGVFKGINGSIYALYVQFPYFSAQRMDFQSPMKVLDVTQLTPGATWTGDLTSKMSLGQRPVHYKVTVLRVGDTYTNAAGAYQASTPIASTWSKSVSVRIDIAVLGVPGSPMEMQQAVFFDFAPGIGVVRRGQAPIQGMAAPTTDRPLLELDQTAVRGITYNQTTPAP